LRCSALVRDSRFFESLYRQTAKEVCGYNRFTILSSRFTFSKNLWFAGIYIQVFGSKSAENSGRYNV
jgi:vancomycin permeability regulator SanA